MDKDLKAAMAATKQELGRVRNAMLAEAAEISERAGDQAILISRLSAKYGVASLTAKRWLIKAGFKLNTALKGRPTFEQVLLHDGITRKQG